MIDITEIPKNIEAEESVIGSLLLDGDLIHGLDLLADDFYSEPNRLCFSACKQLAERGTKINQITLGQELKDRGNLELVGGVAYFSHLISVCASPLDCQDYAKIVKRLATYRSIINMGGSIAHLGYDQSVDISKTIDKVDEMVLSLRKSGTSSPIITPKQRADMMVDRYEKLYTMESGIALPTGLKKLDSRIGGGLYAGELAVLAARPSMGKTTFLLNIAKNLASKQIVLFCSAEMAVEGITDRDVAGEIGVTTNQIRQGGYDDDTYCSITGQGLSSIINRKLYFYHDMPLTCSKILQAGTSMQLRYGLGLIVIDYLGLLDDDYGRSGYERMGYVSRKIKQIAMKLDVPILAAHQLNRALEMRQDKRPQLHDLRDSGRIEEDADLVLFLYRDSYYEDNADNVTEVLIAKQRQGEGHQIVKVYYDAEHQQYRDLETNYKLEL